MLAGADLAATDAVSDGLSAGRSRAGHVRCAPNSWVTRVDRLLGGVGYYGACAISRIHPDAGMRPIWGYMAALLVGLILVAAIPWFSTGFL